MKTQLLKIEEIQKWKESSDFLRINQLIKELNIIKNEDMFYKIDLKTVEAFQELMSNTHAFLKKYILDLLQYILVVETEYRLMNEDEFEEDYSSKRFDKTHMASTLIDKIMRKNLHYDDIEWKEFFNELNKTVNALNELTGAGSSFTEFPINFAIKQIERFLKKNPLSNELASFIEDMLNWDNFAVFEKRWGSDITKSRKKLQAILQTLETVLPFKLLTDEEVGKQINQKISESKCNVHDDFQNLLYLIDSANGGKPPAQFLKTAENLIKSVGKENYRKFAQSMIQVALDTPIITTEHDYQYGSHWTSEYLQEPSKRFFKGLVWTMPIFSDKKSIELIEQLLLKAHTKVKGQGAIAVSVANACIVTLGEMRGKDALGALSRAKLKVKQSNTKKLIDKQLDAGAKKYGVSVSELEEMAVPEFGLIA